MLLQSVSFDVFLLTHFSGVSYAYISDIMVVNVPNINGFPYANVLTRFGEISQTVGKEVNVKV